MAERPSIWDEPTEVWAISYVYRKKGMSGGQREFFGDRSSAENRVRALFDEGVIGDGRVQVWRCPIVGPEAVQVLPPRRAGFVEQVTHG